MSFPYEQHRLGWFGFLHGWVGKASTIKQCGYDPEMIESEVTRTKEQNLAQASDEVLNDI